MSSYLYLSIVSDVDRFRLALYADFLVERGNFDEAERFYQVSLKLNDSDGIVLNNYACFLTQVRRDYVTAERLFAKAIECEAHYFHLRNYRILMKSEPDHSKFKVITLQSL